MLSRITIGWQWLEKTLNAIIDEVNENKPLQSATIAVEESPNGTVLRVVGQSTAQKQQASGSGGGGSSGGPGSGGTWVTITTVDPYTCQMSAIQVWARPVP